MSFSENAIMTRARAIYAQRLTDLNYKDLLNCSTVTEAAEYLEAKTQYFKTFSSTTFTKMNRMMLESLLKRNYIAQFSSLYKFSSIIGNRLCKFFVMLDETTVILSCLRYVLAPNKLDMFISVPTFDNMKVGFNVMALASSENFDEMILKLQDTPYYDLLKEFSDGKPNISKIENKLFQNLYERTNEIAKKSLTKSEYREVFDIIAIYADLKFITNIYRLKKNFKFTPEMIKEYSFTQTVTLLNNREIEGLIRADNAEEFLKILSQTIYKVDPDHIDDIEQWAREYKYKIYSKKILYSTSPNAVMMCCFFLKENEVKNITHIIEGIKYGVEPQDIAKHLVGFETQKKGGA